MDLGRKQAKNFTNPINTTRIKWKESNYDKEDNVPYIAGFFESENSNVLDENAKVFYYNEMAKSVVDREVMERNGATKNEGKREKNLNYDGEVVKFKTDNDTLKFEDVKEEESVNDAVDKIIDFEEPLNCTEEEAKGIGLKAMKCLAYDLRNVKNSDNREFLIKRVKKIVLIWFCVYLAIAVPLWCEKGWCCCCFFCNCCKPQKRIDKIKKFLVENPVGVLKTPKGVIRKFKPTPYEKYTQKKLEQAIMKL
nr:uncharacterized protein LOC111417562 [Onthophagus taurus]